MPASLTYDIIAQVARLSREGTLTGLSEAELLERFLARNDETAFKALVARHGRMVLAVCRRVLRDPHHAEVAFQETFLRLVREARTIRGSDCLGPWLYRVAYCVAFRLRQKVTTRREREGMSSPEAIDGVAAPDRPGPSSSLSLDEMLDGLPEKYRAPIVLCYLEGYSHDEAARQLNWPIGTVKGRLARAREILKDRLSRRGLAVPSGALVAALAGECSASVPASLRESTVRAVMSSVSGSNLAAGAISTSAAYLAREATRTMLTKNFLILSATVTSLLLLVGGAAVVTRSDADEARQIAPDDPVLTKAALQQSAESPSPSARASQEKAKPIVDLPAETVRRLREEFQKGLESERRKLEAKIAESQKEQMAKNQEDERARLLLQANKDKELLRLCEERMAHLTNAWLVIDDIFTQAWSANDAISLSGTHAPRYAAESNPKFRDISRRKQEADADHSEAKRILAVARTNKAELPTIAQSVSAIADRLDGTYVSVLNSLKDIQDIKTRALEAAKPAPRPEKGGGDM